MLLTMIINKIQEFCIHWLVLNKSLGQLLEISPKHLVILKTFDLELEVLFMDKNSKPHKIEDKLNLKKNGINWHKEKWDSWLDLKIVCMLWIKDMNDMIWMLWSFIF